MQLIKKVFVIIQRFILVQFVLKMKIIPKHILTVTVWLICFLTGCLNNAEAVNGQQNHSYIEVTYQSEGVTISGGLWLPEKKGQHPAILTHDKRGAGRSGGMYVQRYNTSPENLNLLAKDISAGVKYLKSRDDIDRNQIGLYGWSQAGWITPIVASFQKNLAFIILISGPTVTTGEENYYSSLTGDGNKSSGLTRQEMSQKIKEKGPYGFDPVPYLKQMDMPGLWLLGDADKSIPIPETVAVLDDLIMNGRKNFTYQVFENANHGLRINGGLVKGYWQVQDDFLKKTVNVQFP